MAVKAHARDIRRANAELPGRLQAIACDDRLSYRERRAILVALGREMDRTTPDGANGVDGDRRLREAVRRRRPSRAAHTPLNGSRYLRGTGAERRRVDAVALAGRGRARRRRRGPGGRRSAGSAPRCASSRASRSTSVSTASPAIGAVKLGQPVPESNLVSDENSSAPQPGAGVRRVIVRVPEGAREGPLGPLAAQHLVLLGRQRGAPFGVGLVHLFCLVGLRRSFRFDLGGSILRAAVTADRVLITVTGPDRTGVTATLTGILSQQGATLHDIEQVVVQGQLTLCLLVDVPETRDVLKELLFAAKQLGMELDFKPVPQATARRGRRPRKAAATSSPRSGRRWARRTCTRSRRRWPRRAPTSRRSGGCRRTRWPRSRSTRCCRPAATATRSSARCCRSRPAPASTCRCSARASTAARSAWSSSTWTRR